MCEAKLIVLGGKCINRQYRQMVYGRTEQTVPFNIPRYFSATAIPCITITTTNNNNQNNKCKL